MKHSTIREHSAAELHARDRGRGARKKCLTTPEQSTTELLPVIVAKALQRSADDSEHSLPSRMPVIVAEALQKSA